MVRSWAKVWLSLGLAVVLNSTGAEAAANDVAAAKAAKRVGSPPVPATLPVLTASGRPLPSAAPEGQRMLVGTIAYDNGVPDARDGQVGGMIGNRFDGPFNDPHSITGFSFVIAQVFSSVVASFWDPNTGAGTAQALARFAINLPVATSSVANFLFNITLGSPLTGHSGSFLAGFHQSSFPGCAGDVALGGSCDGMAVTAGTSDPGRGFHGIRMNFSGFPATVSSVGVPLFPAKNAMMRVTGASLPLELLDFGVK